MSNKGSTADARAAQRAARQHGVISGKQLEQAGIDRFGVHRRVTTGRLHRIHRGVFALGHPSLSNGGHWMAAVLACGEGAVLSHRSAVHLWALLPAAVHPVHVTVPFDRRPRHPGIAIHRSRTLGASEITRRNRIPVTTPARTIRDLRRTEDPEDVRRAIRQAEFLGLPLRGIATDNTRGEGERRFLALCRRHRLPAPEVNARVGIYSVDFLWREERVAVETDDWSGHRGRQAFEDDRQRDIDLRLAGYEVLRVTHRQVAKEPARIATAVQALLGAAVRPSDQH